MVVLVFDLSGVLFNAGLKVAVKKISSKYNLDPEHVENTWNGPFAAAYRKGLETPEEYWKKAAIELPCDDIEGAKNMFFSSYFLQDDMVNLLEKLKQKQVKVAYLSNSPKDRTEFLDEKFNFIELFDFGLFSYQAHAWKPEPEIFQKLIDTFNLDPSELVYIDDREKNLPPAKGLGMQTYFYQDREQFIEFLQSIDIKI